MNTAARTTVVPTFNVHEFAQEAARLTVVPPSCERPTWGWLNETSVPVWNMPLCEIPSGEIDQRAAFLLLHIDGVSSLRDIVNNSGITREDALCIVADMLNNGFIWLQDDVGGAAYAPPQSGIRELSSVDARYGDLVALEALAANR